MSHVPNEKLTRVTDATSEPMTLAEAKQFIRVDYALDDNIITKFITSARLRVEYLTSRSLVYTTWKQTMDYFPPYTSRYNSLLPPAVLGAYTDRNYWLNVSDLAIQLQMPPLVSVTLITYIDMAGTLQTLDPSNYVVATGTPGQIMPAYGKIFPYTRPQLGSVNITFVAGITSDGSTVPANIWHAIGVLCAHYNEHRSDDVPEPRQVMDILAQETWGYYA